MKLLGFNFSKISIEKSSSEFKDRKIETNVTVSEINKVNSALLAGKEEVLGIEFVYTLTYKPNIAKIVLEGGLLISEEESIVKEILKNWDQKKISPQFKVMMWNIILRKCHVRAIALEEELNLPIHITIPSLGIKPQESSEEPGKNSQKKSKK